MLPKAYLTSHSRISQEHSITKIHVQIQSASTLSGNMASSLPLTWLHSSQHLGKSIWNVIRRLRGWMGGSWFWNQKNFADLQSFISGATELGAMWDWYLCLDLGLGSLSVEVERLESWTGERETMPLSASSFHWTLICSSHYFRLLYIQEP